MPHVRPGIRILWKSYCGYVQPTGCRENPDNPVSPSDQWISQESTPDTTTNDRQIGSREEEEVAGPHRINHHCLQLNQVLSDQVFPVLPHVRAEALVTY